MKFKSWDYDLRPVSADPPFVKSIWAKNSAETKVSDLRPRLSPKLVSNWDFLWNRPQVFIEERLYNILRYISSVYTWVSEIPLYLSRLKHPTSSLYTPRYHPVDTVDCASLCCSVERDFTITALNKNIIARILKFAGYIGLILKKKDGHRRCFLSYSKVLCV